jgi:D-3-phosphoglycerate dehydrogenase
MIDLLRGVGQADRGMRRGAWTRHNGRRISESTVGVIGCGRIGRRVIAHLCGGFPGVKILAHDILGPQEFPYSDQVTWARLEEIVSRADVITVHVPLTRATRGLIGVRELGAMQPHALLINTARGGIVDEAALANALDGKRIAGAAIDVFEDEPYTGPLTRCDNILLTCHMGSMTRDCRLRMEIEAAEEAARFARGEPFKCPVPEAEYIIAADRAGYAG